MKYAPGRKRISNESGPCCRRLPTAGRPGIKSNAKNKQRERPNLNSRAAPGAFDTERALTRSPAEAGNMATLDVTKKLNIYHTLYRLNLSFAAIVRHCGTLEET